MESIERIRLGYFETLEYHGNYDTFDDFYEEHKSGIYESIIRVFEEFKNTKKNFLTINLSATISGVSWNSDFNFMREQFFVLKRDILPYFEEEENYEMCNRIMKTYNELVTT